MAALAPRLTRREKVLLGVAGALAVVVILYFGAYRRYEAALSSLSSRLRAQEERLAEAQALAAREGALDDQLKETRGALAEARALIPGGADEIGLLCYLQLSARDGGLVLGALRMGQGAAEGSYFRRAVELDAGGSYTAHLRFLHLLEAMPRLVKVERVWLARAPPPAMAAQTAGGGGEAGLSPAALQAAAPAGCAYARYTFAVFTDPALDNGWAELRVPETAVGRPNPFVLP